VIEFTNWGGRAWAFRELAVLAEQSYGDTIPGVGTVVDIGTAGH